jgi:hypothetical protein
MCSDRALQFDENIANMSRIRLLSDPIFNSYQQWNGNLRTQPLQQIPYLSSLLVVSALQLLCYELFVNIGHNLYFAWSEQMCNKFTVSLDADMQ